jgi:hypothetical protein
MATVIFMQAARMINPVVWYGTTTSATSNTIYITDYNGKSSTYHGANFTYSGSNVSGGTVTGYDGYNNWRWEVTIKNAILDARHVANLINSGNAIGANEYAFSGNDAITGSIYADEILAYAGNDSINGNGGNDYIDGGSGSDTVIFSFAHNTATISAANGIYTIAGSTGTTRVANVENFQFAGVNYSVSNLIAPLNLTPTYKLVSNQSSFNESSTATFTLTTTNLASGTSVPYTLTGITAADVSGGVLSGNAVVNSSGVATISVNLLNDNLTEGTETLTVTAGGITASTVVNDTSNSLKVWSRLFGTNLGDYGAALTTGLDGSIYLSGYSSGPLDGQHNTGRFDAFITKYSPDGTRVWTRMLGTNGSDSYAESKALTTGLDGSIYHSGYMSGSLDGLSSIGAAEVFLAKYSPDGIKVWTRLLGSSAIDFGKALTTGLDGSIYVGGDASSSFDGQTFNGGSGDAFLTKYSPDGIKVWTRLLGTSGTDVGNALTTGLDGSIYLSGWTAGSLDGQIFTGGRGAAFLTKYSPDGIKVWTRLLGTSGGSDSYAQSQTITTGLDGSIYVGGYTTGSLDGQTFSGGTDAFLTKYSPEGTRVWTRLLGSTKDDYGITLTTGLDGSIYLSGWTTGTLDGQNSNGYDGFITKYSPDGTKAWTWLLNAGGASALTTGLDGAIYAGGATALSTLDGQINNGGTDVFLVKYSEPGVTNTTPNTPTTPTTPTFTTSNSISIANGAVAVNSTPANDLITGTAATDTVAYKGSIKDYKVAIGSNGNYTVIDSASSRDGSDVVVNVERLKFSPDPATGANRIALDLAPTQAAGQAALLIGAILPGKLALDPSKYELMGTVIGLFDQFSLKDLSGALLRLPIWDVLTGKPNPTNADIATYLVNNVYGVTSQSANLGVDLARSLAISAMNAETPATQGTYLASLAVSTASQSHIDLVGMQSTGLVYLG